MGNSLSLNLVDYIPGHLSLLYHVSRSPDLTAPGDRLSSAIKRSYDLAQHTSLEVEWIWHIHRLHPKHYERDCERAFGRVIPSQYKAMNPQKEHLHLVEHFDFHCNVISPLPRGIQNAIDNFYPSFDIISAAVRQKIFLVKAKVFFGCTKIEFKKYEKDYICFLRLLSERGPREILIPTLAIDIMWHTHLRLPEMYFVDSKHFLGRLLDHDNKTETTKYEENLLKTVQLWNEKYKKRYLQEEKIKPSYKSKSFEDGTLFAIGAWGYTGYNLGPCDNSTWEWEGENYEIERKQNTE